jgi:L-alanine-DL-glutamate epimerase-like enolase superfamily enzyme
MRGYLEPGSGMVRPPGAPGLGIAIDEGKVASRREVEL